MARTEVHLNWTEWPTAALHIVHEQPLTAEQLHAFADVVAAIEQARDFVRFSETGEVTP